MSWALIGYNSVNTATDSGLLEHGEVASVGACATKCAQHKGLDKCVSFSVSACAPDDPECTNARNADDVLPSSRTCLLWDHVPSGQLHAVLAGHQFQPPPGILVSTFEHQPVVPFPMVLVAGIPEHAAMHIPTCAYTSLSCTDAAVCTTPPCDATAKIVHTQLAFSLGMQVAMDDPAATRVGFVVDASNAMYAALPAALADDHGNVNMVAGPATTGRFDRRSTDVPGPTINRYWTYLRAFIPEDGAHAGTHYVVRVNGKEQVVQAVQGAPALQHVLAQHWTAMLMILLAVLCIGGTILAALVTTKRHKRQAAQARHAGDLMVQSIEGPAKT